jgi:hypothetical protein
MQHSYRIKFLLAVLVTQTVTLAAVNSARGQWPAFGVYHTEGTIKCASAHNHETAPVIQHSWLYEGDKLMLLDNIAEIILFDKDTNYIRLRGKGTYTTAQIEKMRRTHVRDNVTVKYLSLLWEELFRPGSSSLMEKEKIAGSTGGVSRGISVLLAPRDGYSTSMEFLCFRWHSVHWARKYFLRIRDQQGQLRYDSVSPDTMAVVRFPDRFTYGNTYTCYLDLIGESGRLQFADSCHVTLIDETTVLPQLPIVTEDPDSLGGIVILLRRIQQCETNGCIRQADELFHHLTTGHSQDPALDQLYAAFRRRNYME